MFTVASPTAKFEIVGTPSLPLTKVFTHETWCDSIWPGFYQLEEGKSDEHIRALKSLQPGKLYKLYGEDWAFAGIVHTRNRRDPTPYFMFSRSICEVSWLAPWTVESLVNKNT